MYALAGLYLVAQADFELAIAAYQENTEVVVTPVGCAMERTPVNELVEFIAGGEPSARLEGYPAR